MPSGVGQRPVLSPSGHPAVYELRIPGHTIVRPNTETFRYTGAESLEESVGTFAQFQDDISAHRRLQVDGDRFAPTCEDILPTPLSPAGPIDANHLCAHVRQQHAAEWAGADAGQFDYPDSC